MTGASDFAVTLLSSAGASVFLSGALIWLFRTWIGERLRGVIQTEYAVKLETIRVQLKADADAKLESHKAVLKAQGDVELERLRSALAIAANERSAHVSGLVPRRFDAIALTYGNLLRFHQAVTQLVGGLEFSGATREERARQVADAFDTFDANYQPQKIYLTRHTADRIDAIRQRLVSSANLFNLVIARNQNMAEQWIEIEQRVSMEIPAAMQDLEADLRELMGDEPAPAHASRAAPDTSTQE